MIKARPKMKEMHECRKGAQNGEGDPDHGCHSDSIVFFFFSLF